MHLLHIQPAAKNDTFMVNLMIYQVRVELIGC